MRRSKKKAQNVRRQQRVFPMTRVPKGSPYNQQIAPSYDTRLDFVVPFVQTTNGATEVASRFRLNSVFAPDPVTAANKPAGFTEMAANYGSYRVIRVHYEVQLISRETFAFNYLIRATNTDPGTSTGQFVYAGSALSNMGIVNTPGAPKVVCRRTLSIAQITGRPVENDDILAADVTANPSDLVWLGIDLAAYGGSTFTSNNGALVLLKISYFVRFFNRSPVDNAFRTLKERIKRVEDATVKHDLEHIRLVGPDVARLEYQARGLPFPPSTLIGA